MDYVTEATRVEARRNNECKVKLGGGLLIINEDEGVSLSYYHLRHLASFHVENEVEMHFFWTTGKPLHLDFADAAKAGGFVETFEKLMAKL